MSHATSFSSISNLERVDLVIVEFNVNDHFTPGGGHNVPHALEDKGPWSGTSGECKVPWAPFSCLKVHGALLFVFNEAATLTKMPSLRICGRTRVPIALVRRDAASEATPAA